MNKLFLSAAIAAVFLTTAAKAETINCTEITSIPFVITAQGVYCLKSDKSSSLANGNMIDIQTNNVTIDLNGFKLGGLGAGIATHAQGIFASNRQNITVRNGSVRGFLTGIRLIGSSSLGHLVEDVLLDTNRTTAIDIAGNGHLIRNNRVVNTGPGDNNSSAVGMRVECNNTVIADNIISGTSETGASEAIIVVGATLVEVRNNTILDTKDSSDNIGINISSGTAITVIGNRILNAPVTGNGGVDSDASSSGVNCIGNTVVGFASALGGCDFLSGNVTPP